MNFALITRFAALATSLASENFFKQLAQAALRQGHTLTLLHPNEFSLSLGDEKASPLRWHGQKVPDFDLVHHALRWNDEHAWQILTTLQEEGQPLSSFYRLPQGDAVTMARLLARAGVRTPRSWFFAHPDQLMLMQAELPFPCLFFSRGGLLNSGLPTPGRQIFQVMHAGEAAALANQLTRGGEAFLVQEILQPLGNDVQIFAVGGQVPVADKNTPTHYECRILTALERQAPAGQFRPQDDGSALMRPATLSAAEETLVRNVMRLKHLPYAAISLLRQADGPVLLEVSVVPNLPLAETATGIDLAGAMVDQLARQATVMASMRRQATPADGRVVPLGVR